MTGRALIVQGDALHLPLPDESVDLCITSPPYWALRSYSAGPGEIGSEPTPQAFLEALWAATAEMARVLKPGGSIFVNLGDKYEGGGGPSGHTGKEVGQGQKNGYRNSRSGAVPVKSLMLLPERYRIGCVDQTSPYYRAEFYQGLANDLMDGDITPERARQLADEFEASPKSKGLGLICRSVIVWDKPNGLPESVTDRVRRSHEDWVHLVKQPRYYSATDEIREPTPTAARTGRFESYPAGSASGSVTAEGGHHVNRAASMPLNPLGKLPGSVWSIPSEPLRLPDHLGVQHYAAFPSEWPRRLILGFSPPGICVACGQGRAPVVERGEYQAVNGAYKAAGLTAAYDTGQHHGSGASTLGYQRTATILGYACACTPHTDHLGTGEPSGEYNRYAKAIADGGRYPGSDIHGGLGTRPKVGPWREYHLDRWQAPPTRPAVILDPFAGTFTTVMVARALDRIGVGIDLSASYCKAGRWRVYHDGGKAISRTNLERQTTLL